MAIDTNLLFNNAATQTQQTQTQNQSTERLPEVLWLNVGYDTVNSDGETVFVSLPVGIPLTSMKEAVGTSDLAKAKNALREDLIAHGMKLRGGEEIELPLKLMMRRVDEARAATPGTLPRVQL